MIKYPTELKENNAAVGTGRVLIIDDMTKFTPHKFFDYISEGFVPVVLVKENTSITPEFVVYNTVSDEDGLYIMSYKSGDSVETFMAKWDEYFVAG